MIMVWDAKAQLMCVVLAVVVVVVWPGQPNASGQAMSAANLLQNPGNDESLSDGNIPHWREVTGTQWTQRSSDPTPFSGVAYFFAGVAPVAELQQDVNVSGLAAAIDGGGQLFTFSGYVRSWPQTPSDSSQVVIEYRDAANEAVLATSDTGSFSQIARWQLVTNTTAAPPGTRFIRVRLISTRNNGDNNDGYFDALSLSTEQARRVLLPLIQR